MPVTSEKPPLGYCQATAQHERKILAFLNDYDLLQEQTTPLKRPGRGAPLKLHSVRTNLRILDAWLGEWLPPEPHLIADTIFNTLLWQMTEEAAPEDLDRFHKVLGKHWRRIKNRLTEQTIIIQGRLAYRAMTNKAAWRELAKVAKASRAKRETRRSKKTEPAIYDSIYDRMARKYALA